MPMKNICSMKHCYILNIVKKCSSEKNLNYKLFKIKNLTIDINTVSYKMINDIKLHISHKMLNYIFL